MARWLSSLQKIVFVTSTRKEILMIMIFLAYLSFGALIFALSESFGPSDLESMWTPSKLVREMVQTLRDKGFEDSEIARGFAEEHYQFRKDPSEFQITWTDVYGEKVMFSLVLLETIGYGNVVPTSEWSRFFAIVFLLIGRPIQVTMNRLLGLKFRIQLRNFLEYGQRFRRRNLPVYCSGQNCCSYATGALFFGFYIVIFLIIPAAIFKYFESWSYLEGFYYSYLSLATIGLGDYIAGVSTKHYPQSLFGVYVGLMFFWIMFGVSYLKVCETLISYTLGTYIIDKLDGKSEHRRQAREQFTHLYSLVAELHFKLTKYCPKDFEKMRVYQDFMDLCAENPEEITEETLLELLEATEDLKIVSGEALLMMSVPKEFHQHQEVVRDSVIMQELPDLSSKPITASDIVRATRKEDETRGGGQLTITEDSDSIPPATIVSANDVGVSSADIDMVPQIPRLHPRSRIESLLNKSSSEEITDASEATGSKASDDDAPEKASDKSDDEDASVKTGSNASDDDAQGSDESNPPEKASDKSDDKDASEKKRK